MVVDKLCEDCGEMMYGVSHNKRFCKACIRKHHRENAKNAYFGPRNMLTVKTCKYCGKEFTTIRADGKPFCTKGCEKAYNKKPEQNAIKPKRIKRRKEDVIEIERRVHGVADIPRRKSNYREAKQMYYHAYDMRNAAILVWVNGERLSTIPQADAYFGIGKNKARWNGDILGVFGGV